MKPLVLYHAARLSEIDAAYLAGLIDGEAYVGITGSRNSKPAKQCKKGVALRVVLQIRMTERAPLDWAIAITACGTVRPVKKVANQRQAWDWSVWSRQAASILYQIRPFLKVKHQQADLCIEYQSRMRRAGTPGLSDDEWQFRLSCWDRSKEINRAS